MDELTKKRLELTVLMAKALQTYGTPAHRLEEALSILAGHMDLDAQFFSTPTAIFASFTKGDFEKTVLLRINTGDVHLERLDQINSILESIGVEKMPVEEALGKMRALMASPERWGPWWTLLSFIIASSAASRFLGGGWREVLVGGVIGLLIGCLGLVSQRSRTIGNVFAPISAITAAMVAQGALVVFDPFSPFTATLAGLIVLIPGLSFTTAMVELATGHLASGTARLANATSVFLLMTFGLALGTQLVGKMTGTMVGSSPEPLPLWTQWVALALAPAAFGILFRAHPRDFWLIFLSGFLAFFSARWGGHLLGPQLGGFLAAFVLGIACNLFTRLTQKPAAIPLEPGIIFLVPGTVGLRSLAALLQNDTLSGVNTAFTMVLVALSLVMGLLFANVMVSPKRVL
ncbi:MAG: threonine/serine exporter family protein [Acidobacteria bacterium]|nr:threonine/serine exporter family protein [Acidobacteriota bacterium]